MFSDWLVLEVVQVVHAGVDHLLNGRGAHAEWWFRWPLSFSHD
jgi:hypothetical protein